MLQGNEQTKALANEAYILARQRGWTRNSNYVVFRKVEVAE